VINKFTKITVLLTILVWIATPVTPGLSMEKRRIAVVHPKMIKPYKDALASLKKEAGQGGMPLQFENFDFADARDRKDAFTKKVSEFNPDLIVTIGTKATIFTKDTFNGTPIVFTMVLDPLKHKIIKSMRSPAGNITGTSLQIPIELQFQKLKEMLPGLKKIGMLYDAKKKVDLKNQAQAAAQKLGLVLVAKPVYEKRDVLDTLNDLLNDIDALWAGVDSFVYNKASSKPILLETLRHNKPFMSFSASYVKAGALFALECDYSHVGAETGKKVVAMLEGKTGEAISIAAPEKVRLTINERTAKLIGISIPAALKREATMVGN